MQKVLPCTNMNRTMLAKEQAMGQGFDSDIADFRDMAIANFQVVWDENIDALDGTFEIFASNFQEPYTFAKYPDSLFVMDGDCQSLMWEFTRFGFRYGFIRYTPNSVTTGTLKAVAVAKKAG